jgi:hypothetical protein
VNCHPKILFILKKRGNYGPSFGLKNSCSFICNSLSKIGIECKVVEVIDNNGIDREVFNYKPSHVVLEAYWVVPSKFNVLLPKYKNIFWTVRSHSKIPFFQQEGICIDWTKDYNELAKKYPNFSISSNTKGFINPIERTLDINVDYLPNIYEPPKYCFEPYLYEHKSLNIGLFSAIRPQKNLLIQGMSAMQFADSIDKKLRLHIMCDRIEQKGEPILKNLIELFKGNKHDLICHKWMSHKDFINLVRRMDLGLSVSNSESFCIVAADFVHNNIPIIGSSEIEWMNCLYKADPNNFNDIVNKLSFAYDFKCLGLHNINKIGLSRHNKMAQNIWINWIYKTQI